MMKKIILFVVGAMLMMATSTMATSYYVGATNVGDVDVYMDRTKLDNSGVGTGLELAWVNGALGTSFLSFVKNETPDGSGWQATDNSTVFAFDLQGTPEYFLIKTGKIGKDTDPDFRDFLFKNISDTGWAVVDLGTSFGSGYDLGTDYKKFSHIDEFGGTPVPEPGTMMLLGIGMFGMAVYGKRRMYKES